MCSLGDDNFENETNKFMKIEKKIQLSNLKCNKCKEKPPCVVLRQRDAYCKDCFLNGTIHKFKQLLGKYKLIRPNDRVLVLYKIGHSGTALLHFLRSGLDLQTPKQLRFEPVILFVDDQFQLLLNEREDLLNKVKNEVEQFKFKLHLASFTEYVTQSNSISNIIKESTDPFKFYENDVVRSKIAEKASKTTKQDIYRILKRQLLVDTAKHLNCKFVFTTELCLDIASELLTNVSLGRGAHVPVDTGFCDDRDPDVKVLRPLRLFTIQELAFYNHFNNLQPVFVRELTNVNPYSSVQDLMKKFVNDLQMNYPATVTTILKTGDKLDLEMKEDQQICKLCKNKFNRDSSELSSSESTRFSHWVSTQTPDYAISPQERYSNIADNFNNIKQESYCYSCDKIVDFIL